MYFHTLDLNTRGPRSQHVKRSHDLKYTIDQLKYIPKKKKKKFAKKRRKQKYPLQL